MPSGLNGRHSCCTPSARKVKRHNRSSHPKIDRFGAVVLGGAVSFAFRIFQFCSMEKRNRRRSLRCSCAVCFVSLVKITTVSCSLASCKTQSIARERSATSLKAAHFWTPSSTSWLFAKKVAFARGVEVMTIRSANRSSAAPPSASSCELNLSVIAKTHHSLPLDFME